MFAKKHYHTKKIKANCCKKRCRMNEYDILEYMSEDEFSDMVANRD